ncbi:MAG: hypothetical protein L3J54_06015, partial [Draconibacterium sp.]|nr:hypothetical protein [Draconibacterium sp.]
SLLYVKEEIIYDEKALKHLSADSFLILKTMGEAFKALNEFNHEAIETACRELADKYADGKLGKVMMPLRSALTGTDKSPSLFEVAEVLGQETTCSRIQVAIDMIEK